MYRYLIALALVLVLPLIAWADINGPPRVIDGDTLELYGQGIRLHGIDAPESKQLCYLDGKRWQCGKDAGNILSDLIDHRTVKPQGLTATIQLYTTNTDFGADPSIPANPRFPRASSYISTMKNSISFIEVQSAAPWSIVDQGMGGEGVLWRSLGSHACGLSGPLPTEALECFYVTAYHGVCDVVPFYEI